VHCWLNNSIVANIFFLFLGSVSISNLWIGLTGICSSFCYESVIRSLFTSKACLSFLFFYRKLFIYTSELLLFACVWLLFEFLFCYAGCSLMREWLDAKNLLIIGKSWCKFEAQAALTMFLSTGYVGCTWVDASAILCITFEVFFLNLNFCYSILFNKRCAESCYNLINWLILEATAFSLAMSWLSWYSSYEHLVYF